MDLEEFNSIRQTVRSYIRTEVVPREQEIEETDAIPDELRRGAAEMGLFGYALPEEYGGLGLTMREDVELAFEFGYTTPSFRSLFGGNNGIGGQSIARFGTDEMKAKYLPRIASGDLIVAFGLTEEEAGSDPSGMRTRAEKTPDGYTLNGRKRYITNAPLAGIFVVFARKWPEGDRPEYVSVVIPADAPGLTLGPKDKKMGHSGSWTCEVIMDDVHVPSHDVIGDDDGRGLTRALSVLSRGRLHIAALCVGVAERILEESIQYAANARQGGEPIGRFQLIQAMLADSATEVTAAKALVRQIADEYDAQVDIATGPSMAKLFCSEMVSRVTDRGVQIFGGLGYMRSTAVERFYRDARLYRIYEGTSEVQRTIIGRSLIKNASSM